MEENLTERCLISYPCANTRMCPAETVIRRIHFTCLFSCIPRRQLTGNLPKMLHGEIRMVSVTGMKAHIEFLIFVRDGRSHDRFKDLLVRTFASGFAKAMNEMHDFAFFTLFKPFWTLMEVLLS